MKENKRNGKFTKSEQLSCFLVERFRMSMMSFMDI